MKVTHIIELTDAEMQVVKNFVCLTDTISEVTGCSIDELGDYILDRAVKDNDNQFYTESVHHIVEIE